MGTKKIKPPRIVLDTNVVIAALLFSGKASNILSLCQEKKVTFLASKEVIEEYIKVLSYPRFSLNNDEIEYLIKEEIIAFIEPIHVRNRLKILKEGPSDNKFLSLAIDGKADYIISGDRHLLGLKIFRKIKIITITEFLEKFYRRHS
jgi:hypothetical protein